VNDSSDSSGFSRANQSLRVLNGNFVREASVREADPVRVIEDLRTAQGIAQLIKIPEIERMSLDRFE
jgi:hypothetical protein